MSTENTRSFRMLWKTGLPMGVLVGALVLAICIPLTVAQFSAGFSGAVGASGAIDIAQTKIGDAGQHATAESASELESNGLAIAQVASATSGWPARDTATIEIPVHNRSDGSISSRVRIAVAQAPGQLADFLLFGASVDGTPVIDAPVTAAWFDQHSDGLQLAESWSAKANHSVTVSVWLASDAPDGMLGQELELELEVVGETRAGDEPVLVEGIWK